MIRMEKKLNPIIEALDVIDEDTALAAAPQKRRMKKPLKIVIISAAAAMLLGTTASAATLGDNPLIKINGVNAVTRSSSYVNEDGYTILTRYTTIPGDDNQIEYEPVGEIRATYSKDIAPPIESALYDELGVKIDGIVSNCYCFVDITKDGETPMHKISMYPADDYYHNRLMGNPDGEYFIECWQDPIQIALQKLSLQAYYRMTTDEKIEKILYYGYDYGLPDHGGFQHPTMRQLLDADAYGTDNVQRFKTLPGEALKLYGYAPVSLDGFSEREGLLAVNESNHYYVEKGGKNHLERNPDPKIIQQIFVYTLTDDASGKDVKFTVWRSAEEKDTYTGHFGFEYEYIPLLNGTEARLHQSVCSDYIAEFEKDGTAYAIVLAPDMELVKKVLKGMELL